MHTTGQRQSPITQPGPKETNARACVLARTGTDLTSFQNTRNHRNRRTRTRSSRAASAAAARSRLSPKTLEAYGRDLRQCLDFLCAHWGERVTLARFAALEATDVRAFMAMRRADDIAGRSLMRFTARSLRLADAQRPLEALIASWPVLMLFASKVPDKSGVCAVLQQRRLLGCRGLKSEPHATTLWTTTDIPRRERRCLPSLKAGVSTPQTR